VTFRPTPAVWAQLGGALVLTTAATVLGIGGARTWLRESAAADAVHGYFRTADPGTGGLEMMNLALDRAPADPALKLLKASMLAARTGERERAEALFQDVARLATGDEAERRLAGLARCGWAAQELERLRDPERTASGAARADALARVVEALEGAAKLSKRRLEPHAFLAAARLEQGDNRRAREAIEAALAATEPPTLGGRLTLLCAVAEHARREGSFDAEVRALEEAITLAPALAAPAKAGAPPRPDLRARLVRALARRLVDPALDPGRAEDVRRDTAVVLAPVHPMERYRKAALYGLDASRTTLVREAVAVSFARAGSLDSARRALEEALRDSPNEPGLLRQLAGVLAASARAEQNPAARKGLARRASDAIGEAGDRAKVGGRPGYELYLAAAVHARDAGMLEQATRYLERAAACIPDADEDARFHRARAVVLDQWGKATPALEAYRKALARAPADPDAAAIERRIAYLEAKRR
jgi:tetratricopeptide (TPR) repeat protein